MVTDDWMTQSSWPWRQQHSVADTESALISDLFDIFVLIVHNACFGVFDTDVSFRIFIPHFANC